MYTVHDLYDLTHTQAAPLLEEVEYPWQALAGISGFILSLGSTLSAEEYDHPSEDVWIAKSAKVAPTANITGPCIIGPETEVRHCAFIRGKALIGAGCVVGNSTELKNVILFDQAKVPHYNYVGDSILGFQAHMGAGSITSNVKSDKTLVVIRDGEERFPTGLKKVGAMLGDRAEIGCNTVMNPGTVIGRDSSVYPTSCVRGTVPANSIFKDQAHIVPKAQ
mgnify:FL=1